MFSKFGWKLLVMILIAGFMSSCRLTGESEAKPALPPNKIGSEARCLSHVLPSMRNFLNGSASTEEVSSTWTCFESALDLFGKKVRGAHPAYYESREVADFFEAYFLAEDTKISDSLLTEIMKLKQIFVGGENQRVTREELTALTDFARKMRGLSIEILPHMKILSMNWAVTGANDFAEDLQKFDAAQSAAEKTVQQIASWIEPNKQAYQILSLARLMREMQDLYKESWPFVAALDKNLPILQELKRSLIGSDPTLIRADEWHRVGQLLVRGYSQYLRYTYFLRDNAFASQDHDYKLLFKSVDELLFVVGDFLQQKPSQRISRAELEDLASQIEKLLADSQLSPQFVEQVLKVKALLFGGSDQDLSQVDTAVGRKKIPAFQAIVSLFVRHADLYGGRWSAQNMPHDMAKKEFQSAETDLGLIGQLLAPLFESSYDLENLPTLLSALQKAFPHSKPLVKIGEEVRRYLPFVENGKNILLKDKSTVIGKGDWALLLSEIAPLFSRYQGYVYFLKDSPPFWDLALGDLDEWIHELASNINAIFEVRGKGTPTAVEVDEIIRLIDSADKSDMLPSLLPAKVLKALVPVLVHRILTAPEARLAGHPETAFGPVGLDNVVGEIDAFLKVQKKLSGLFSTQPQWSHPQLQTAFQNAVGEEQELQRILATPNSFAFDNDGRMYIDTNGDIPYTREAILRMNLVRSLVRLAIRSYAEDLTRAKDLLALTRDEVAVTMFQELKPILVGAGLIDERNTRFARNRFLEANLFTPFGNGDAMLDFPEFSSLGLMIWSGIHLNTQVSVTVRQLCPIRSTNSELYDVACSMEQIRQQIPKIATSLPGQIVSFQKMSPAEGDALLVGILGATGWEPNNLNTAEKSDLALVPHVLQYIESIFRRWDINKDGIIDLSESMIAEPTFRPLLSEVSGFSDPQILRAAFAYILVYGKEPEDLNEFFDWMQKEGQWPVAVDRPQIAKILAYISERVRKK